mmetsp:Transcript_14465/g.36313  ORF Transcript_14465/g.36313 Transcript_14465/m.36313 type:complete len:352 (+) Transcript_14465:164-1219(+)
MWLSIYHGRNCTLTIIGNIFLVGPSCGIGKPNWRRQLLLLQEDNDVKTRRSRCSFSSPSCLVKFLVYLEPKGSRQKLEIVFFKGGTDLFAANVSVVVRIEGIEHRLDVFLGLFLGGLVLGIRGELFCHQSKVVPELFLGDLSARVRVDHVKDELGQVVEEELGVVLTRAFGEGEFLEGRSLGHVRSAQSKGHVHAQCLKVVKGKPQFFPRDGTVRVRVDGFVQIFRVFLGVSHFAHQVLLEFFQSDFPVAILVDAIKDGIDLVQQINILLLRRCLLIDAAASFGGRKDDSRPGCFCRDHGLWQSRRRDTGLCDEMVRSNRKGGRESKAGNQDCGVDSLFGGHGVVLGLCLC